MAQPTEDSVKKQQEQSLIADENSHQVNNQNHNQIVTQPVHFSPYLESEEDARIAAEMVKTGAKHHNQWNRRLKVIFCCLGYKKNKDSIADVASIFAEYFADLNIPSSDIAAGFVLLSKYQAAQREWIVQNKLLGVEQFLSYVPIKEDTQFLDISSPEDSYLINDLIYYMNYSLATFGWPLHMLEKPCTVCCIYPHLKLAPCCSFGRRKKSDDSKSSGLKKKKGKKSGDGRAAAAAAGNEDANGPSSLESDNKKSRVFQASNHVPGQLDEINNAPIVLDDNCCSCNFASAERRLAAHNYEIIYMTYRCAVGVLPFLVAADHSKRTIVVAIRGSMGLADWITDMNGTVDKLPIENCPDDWLCHRGVTQAASYVKSTLLQEHILDRAFNCRPDLDSQEYSLLLCGHSLGAGAAAVLGVLLHKQYPKLKAYLYSPPGGMLSLPVVEYTKQFATGVTLGNDTVARLGIAQMERLRYQTLLSLQSSESSASKILTKAICPTCCFGSNKVDYDPSQSIDLLHGTRGRSFDYNATKIPFQVQTKVLYVPGKLIHIVRNYSFKASTRPLFNKPLYQAVWTDNRAYDRVIISKGMLSDHLPHNLNNAMKMLFSNTLPGRRESQLTKKADVVVNQTAGVRQGGQHPEIKEMSQKLEEKVIAISSDDNNNNESGKLDAYDNNNEMCHPDANVYPRLGSIGNSTEQIYNFEPHNDYNHDVKSGSAKGICDNIDENGNEKTNL